MEKALLMNMLQCQDDLLREVANFEIFEPFPLFLALGDQFEKIFINELENEVRLVYDSDDFLGFDDVVVV